MSKSTTAQGLPFAPGDKVKWVGPITGARWKLSGGVHEIERCWHDEALGDYNGAPVFKVLLVGLRADRRSWKDGAFLARHFQSVGEEGAEKVLQEKPTAELSRNQVVMVSGGIAFDGQPKSEGGAWCGIESPFIEGHTLRPRDVYAVCVSQASEKSNHRSFIGSRIGMIFIISDSMLDTHEAEVGIAMAGLEIESITGAREAAKGVMWIYLPAYAKRDQIVRIATAELALRRRQRTDLGDSDVMFILWRANPLSFGGEHLQLIGNQLRDEVFTFQLSTGDDESWSNAA